MALPRPGPALRSLAAAAAAWTGAAAAAAQQANSPYTFQEPATAIAREQAELHFLVLVVIVLIGAAVFAVMLYSIVKHRKDAGHKAANFHESTTVEIIWTVIPFLIIAALAFPATRVIIDARDATNPDMTVKVVGYQWKWSYDYLDENLFFYSTLATPPEQIGSLLGYGARTHAATEVVRSENYLLEVDEHLVVPVGKKVRLLITAADVLHSWAVPALGVKQDAIPGIVREAWFRAEKEGIYRGQCTELCGKNHAFMPIVVEVVSEAEYATWLAARGGGATEEDLPVAVGDVVPATAPASAGAAPAEWTAEAVYAYGEQGYTTHCVACHQADGQGLPPTFPALAGTGIAVGGAEPHIDIVLNGKAGTTMASFAYLSDAEIAAIVHYERNAWGNDSGDLVTPEDVAARR
ncbi:MAG: cytochrome c oxidase subunit II [Betaproteobacteria bacterium AqS2]|uniref:Cytochrome c oxidase subunit 2 n=1 Tax=Candidatus Amphirhobacter heronislandensis TaxID=1732024 RepID=A0A930XYJ5_9GAMM|nr:cytochrome c oxidase subunit II [Betaproteobacteria bacterium AqS2]